eukprot:111024_1
MMTGVLAVKRTTIEEAMKVHEAFRPLLLSKILRETLDEITINKKARDDAQIERLNRALKILAIDDVALPAYPDKTYESLKSQMKKQLKKMSKPKKKKDDK